MIEILSLPRRPHVKVVQIKDVKFKSGLPINSLPGWEHIPLNSKLPMLKCPGNQVIFSKNKIGQSFKHLKQEFDPSGRENFPEYNPLHDSNLQTFYANERNLKRLRENGEITQNNDVICNLKDFNEYRQQLHKSQLYYILQELNRLEAEQRDRMLITNAESITNRDHRNLSARQHSYTEILLRKKKLDNLRAIRFQKYLQHTEEKFQRIAGLEEMRRVWIEHKKALNTMKMQQVREYCLDYQRKHLISLKKLYQFKKDRFHKNLRTLEETKRTRSTKAQIESWEKRLDERISNQLRMEALLQEVADRRKMFIEQHRTRYKEKWAIIQEEIKHRSRCSKLNKRTHRHKKKRKPKPVEEPDRYDRRSFCPDYQESFEKLLDAELCEALNAALDMETNLKIPFNPDDPIYKAAKFIMQHVIRKFDKDMSCDKITFNRVAERIGKFFDESKKIVLFRATQIISNARSQQDQGCIQQFGGGERVVESPRETNRLSLPKNVSFSKLCTSTIGTSSYELHPYIDVRKANDRTPTPAGSLASIVVDSRESLINKTKTEHLCRNEMVFVEHFVIKFKRELIVGMGKRVFAAIQCHFENKIMDVRRELLELDKKFLVNQVTKSILSYAKNPLDFKSCLKLCISALSSDIIWSLQKHLLRPQRDPRGIVYPAHCCKKEADKMRLCLYCHN